MELQLDVQQSEWLRRICVSKIVCTAGRITERELRCVGWMYSRVCGLKGILERQLDVQHDDWLRGNYVGTVGFTAGRVALRELRRAFGCTAGRVDERELCRDSWIYSRASG